MSGPLSVNLVLAWPRRPPPRRFRASRSEPLVPASVRAEPWFEQFPDRGPVVRGVDAGRDLAALGDAEHWEGVDMQCRSKLGVLRYVDGAKRECLLVAVRLQDVCEKALHVS